MKRLIATLTLCMLAGSAMAKSGTVTFEGSVSSGGTCPIDVISPVGPGINTVYLGDFKTSQFTGKGQGTAKVPFRLRIDPTTCDFTSGESAYVTFTDVHGVDPSGKFFSLRSGPNFSEGLALALYDKTKQLEPGSQSVGHLVDDNTPTLMNFTAQLQTIEDAVTEGQILASVSFNVDIR